MSGLASEPFSFRCVADGRVLLFHEGRLVETLAGAAAERFTAAAADADPAALQLLMAKATKNFRRGNERLAKSRSRR